MLLLLFAVQSHEWGIEEWLDNFDEVDDDFDDTGDEVRLVLQVSLIWWISITLCCCSKANFCCCVHSTAILSRLLLFFTANVISKVVGLPSSVKSAGHFAVGEYSLELSRRIKSSII